MAKNLVFPNGETGPYLWHKRDSRGIMADKIHKLRPHISHKVWGGQRLIPLRDLPPLTPSVPPVGETWEISRHPDGPAQTEDGESLKKKFSKEQMPYLVKLIDTNDFLSVQVHPDDEFAQTHEGEQGKAECWLVLEAQENAGIYLGFKPGVSRENFEEALKQEKGGANPDSFLAFYPVERGDFFFVPAGAIHAIGKGVLLVEIQQSSGITYRVWDWNRTGSDGNPRPLHLKKAMQVIRFENSFNHPSNFQRKRELLNFTHKNRTSLIQHPQFHVELLVSSGESWHCPLEGNRQPAIMVLEGKVKINGIELKTCESCLPMNQKAHISGKKAWACLLVH